MTFHLPTRDECQAIVAKSDSFYCNERLVNGFKVELYDYRLASISDFVDNNAFELRGLTFVQHPSTGEWSRHILLNKFFNVNQTEGWMYDDLKPKRIARVQDKLDGSVISFVRLPDGTTRAKSKMSFDSDQATMAQSLYDNSHLIQSFIAFCNSEQLTPIYELVSPNNQIVLEYPDTRLVLLQVRRSDGTYLTKHQMDNLHPNVPHVADDYLATLDELLVAKTTREQIEGWIVTFEDGQMAKIKTNWYLHLHGLIGPDAFRENLLVESILSNTIDDAISQLPEGIKKSNVQSISELVQHHFNHSIKLVLELRNSYHRKYNHDRKQFALAHKNHPLFPIVMKTLNTPKDELEKSVEDQLRQHFLKKTHTLSGAQSWIASLKQP